MNAALRCVRCDEPGKGEACACGGVLGAGFALELHRGGAPQPPDDRDVRGTLSGRIALRLPPGRDSGVVTATVYGRARAGQAAQDVVFFERELTLHTGAHERARVKPTAKPGFTAPAACAGESLGESGSFRRGRTALQEHTIWPFELPLPPGPPSFDGPLVRVEWRLRARWTPPDGADRAWGWSLNVLPSPAEASPSLRHRLAWWAARVDDAFAVFSKLAVVAAWAAAPIVSALFQQRWLLLLVPICAYFAWLGLPWARHHGPMLAAGARGWTVPRPRFPRALHIGDTAAITVDPRYDWQLLRIEESASRRHGMVGSTPGIRTEWATSETVMADGEGSGTLVHPADQPPSVTTTTRRIRWEIRAHLRGDPTGYQPFYLEILPTRRPGR